MLTNSITAVSLTAMILSLVRVSPIAAQSNQVTADSAQQIIEIRLARPTPASDFRQMAEPRSSRSVYVSGKSEFKDSDFVKVRSQKDSINGLALIVEWTPEAARRFTQILRGQIPAGVNMVAVFVDGELVNTPAIIVDSSASMSRETIISVPVTSEKVSRIEAAVARRWPRRG